MALQLEAAHLVVGDTFALPNGPHLCYAAPGDLRLEIAYNVDQVLAYNDHGVFQGGYGLVQWHHLPQGGADLFVNHQVCFAVHFRGFVVENHQSGIIALGHQGKASCGKYH